MTCVPGVRRPHQGEIKMSGWRSLERSRGITEGHSYRRRRGPWRIDCSHSRVYEITPFYNDLCQLCLAYNARFALHCGGSASRMLGHVSVSTALL